MRHRSVQTRAGSLTAAAVLASALVGFGIQSSADAGFTLDVRLAPTQGAGVTVAGKTATIASSFTGNINLQVWGQVTGADANANEGLQDAFFGVGSTKGGAGTPTGNLSTVTLAAPWNGPIDVGGTTYSTGYGGGTYANADGNANVGSTNSALPDGWAFSRSTTMTTTGGSAIAGGMEWLLGTLTYNVTAAGSGDTSINAIGRTAGTNVVPAVWLQDGQAADGNASIGTAVTIHAAGGVVVAGDVNHDGIVDLGDINYVTARWLNNGSDGDADGNGIIDLGDINYITARWLNTSEPGGIAAGALAAVPEPTSLGILGLGAIGLVARRRK